MANKSQDEQNEHVTKMLKDPEYVKKIFSPWAAARLLSLPDFTQKQLLTEREVHGSILFSQIETERLLAHLVDLELKRRKKLGEYSGSFAPISHFFGYQGRCAMPSHFDCRLGSALGYMSGVMIEGGLTGYCPTARGITGDIDKWHLGGIPLINMCRMKATSTYGQNVAIIPSSEVKLKEGAFMSLYNQREEW